METTSLERPPKKRSDLAVSLADVAARARVSVGTVSHVLNRNERARIAPGTQERIWKIASEMGYRPNLFARGLHGKASRTLGLMIPGLQNPFFVAVAREFELLGAEFGYQVVIDTTKAEAWADHEHAANYSWPVDGAFVFLALDQNLNFYRWSQASRLPIVYLGIQKNRPMDNVLFDIAGGGRQLAEHLLSKGYRRPAVVSTSEFALGSKVEDRVAAFNHVFGEQGIVPEHILIDTVSIIRDTFNGALRIAERSREDLPDVMFCTDDITAIGVYNAFRSRGLRIPEDVAIAGFDGIIEGQCMERRLTTVDCPITEFARSAFEMLASRIASSEDAPSRQVTIPTTLRIGQTTR